MTAFLARLVPSGLALAALLLLSLHVMAPADQPSAAAAHAVHGTADTGGDPGDLDGPTACAVHCLVAAVLEAAGPAPEHALHPIHVPAPRVRLVGFTPQPLGPPPKPVVSA